MIQSFPESLRFIVDNLWPEYIERGWRAYMQIPLERRLSLVCSFGPPGGPSWHVGVAADPDEILRDIRAGDNELARQCAALNLLHAIQVRASAVDGSIGDAPTELT